MKLSKEVKVGSIVLVAIIALIWGVNFLKGIDVFTSNQKFYVVYDRVDGLTKSNAVTINGLKIGQVKTIRLLNDRTGRILAVIFVDKHVQVTKKSIARIVSADLLGTKAIELEIDSLSPVAENGDTLLASIQMSLGDAVSLQVAPIKKKAENLLASIDSVMMVVQGVFNEESRESISASFVSISHTMKSLESTSHTLDTLLTSEQHKLKSIFSNVESITANLQANNEMITNVLKNFSNISDSIAKADVAMTIRKTNQTLAETQAILAKINRGEGSLGLLLNNDKLYHNLTNTALDLDRLLIDFRMNPKRYINFSIISTGSGSKSAPSP